jgi:hypothetical protein
VKEATKKAKAEEKAEKKAAAKQAKQAKQANSEERIDIIRTICENLKKTHEVTV